MALFITFEGGEGSGKTLQAKMLYRRLCRLSIPAVLTHEPGGTNLGNRVRRWLKQDGNTDISPLAELLMFNASRSQLVTGVVQPNLSEGNVVICDRYTDSTVAYQSYGRGLPLEMVRAVNDIATGELKPALTILLDIAAEEALLRKRDSRRDRFERENMPFHQRVREGYLTLAAGEPERWLVIDATRPKEEIAQIIWKRVRQLLAGQDD